MFSPETSALFMIEKITVSLYQYIDQYLVCYCQNLCSSWLVMDLCSLKNVIIPTINEKLILGIRQSFTLPGVH